MYLLLKDYHLGTGTNISIMHWATVSDTYWNCVVLYLFTTNLHCMNKSPTQTQNIFYDVKEEIVTILLLTQSTAEMHLCAWMFQSIDFPLQLGMPY